MAGFVEKVVIEVQARTQGAVNDMRAMGNEVKQSEGFFAKAKAGVGGLLDTVKGMFSGPQAIGAAGAAVLAASIKMASGFTDAALAADDMANRTGLATEEASRWIAVADDLGVSAESVSGAAQKMATNLGKAPEKFAELGITAKDTNTAMLQAIDVLNKTPEGAQRAALGMELFGKSWGTMAELIAQGSDAVKESLEDVSDAQVFDTEEVAKAKKYREAMDTLGDSVNDLSLTLGEELAPALAEAATALARLADSEAVKETLGVLAAGVEATAESLHNLLNWDSGGEFKIEIPEGLEALQTVLKSLGGDSKVLTEEMVRLHDAQVRAVNPDVDLSAWHALVDQAMTYQGTVQRTAEDDAKLERSQDDAADAAKRHEDALKGLNEQLGLVNDSARDAISVDLKLEDAAADLADALKDQADAAKKGGKDYEEASRKVTKAAENQAKAELDKAKQMAAASGSTLTTTEENEVLAKSYDAIAAKLAPGDPLRQRLNQYSADLRAVPTAANTTLTANTSQAQAEILRLHDKLNEARIAAALLEAEMKGVKDVARSWILGAGPTGFTSTPAVASTTIVNVPPTLNPGRVLAAVGAGEHRSGGMRRG